MKHFFFISLFFYSHLVFSQDDFFSIYHKIDAVFARQKTSVDYDPTLPRIKDTLSRNKQIRRGSLLFRDSIISLTNKLVNMNFPDISFTDANNKAYAISDFAGKEIVVNYNYLYCQPCLDRIDSTVYLLKDRKVQILLLFSDVYQRETNDLKNFGDNVLVGFISDDNKNLISLALGDNCMYYLNTDRRIEFFDKANTLSDNEIAWTQYLKTNKQ